METVCQVSLNLMSSHEARAAESVLRRYLLRAADQMSVTVSGSSYMSIIHLLPRRYQRRRFLSMLAEGDVAAQGEHSWTFNLTDNIKKLLDQTGILISGKSKIFSGFTDPKFLRNGTELATIIVNEGLITLYIPDSDKAELAAQGVYLDSPEI